MDKIVYRFVYNRKNHLNNTGKALIQLEALQQGRRCYFTTHLYLRPNQWDKRRQRIIHHPLAKELNRKLDEQMIAAERIELLLWRQGEDVTLKKLKTAIAQPRSRTTFLEFFLAELKKASIRTSTRQNHLSTWLLLRQFRPTILFNEVNIDLITQFEQFMRQKGYHVNTIAKHLKHLKRYVNLAIKQLLIPVTQDPFKGYHIRKSDTHYTFLTLDELQRLEHLQLNQRQHGMRHTLDAFLFCCYSGLRYSDFTHLTAENISYSGDAECWLTYRSVKTSVEVRNPLHLLFGGKGMDLLARYCGKEADFFQLGGNSNVNKQLSVLAVMAGIEKHISFHTARHTNATLLIYSGVNITTVQRLLGHRSVRTTQGYTDVMDQTVIHDLECHQLLQ